MKKHTYFLYFLISCVITAGCQKTSNDDISFVQTATASSDGTIGFLISNDNSGNVTITPSGTGVTTFDVYFGDATTIPATVQPGKSITHAYKEGSYTVKVDAKAPNGTVTSTTKPLTVTYRAPENVVLNAVVNGHDVTFSATALYAPAGFKIYFGDVPNEVPTSLAAGATVTHNYVNVGSYTIKAVALSGGVATTTSASQVITIVDLLSFPITFESPTLNYSFTDFAGGNTTVIANPQVSGINTSSKVCRMIKFADQVYGGSVKSLGNAIDFSVKKTIKMKVFSPRVGAKVLFKVEDKNNSGNFFEREVVTTVANAWEELTFNYSAISTTISYHNIVIIFDNGIMGNGSANFTFLFDDITLN
jgi:hypothetical protein